MPRFLGFIGGTMAAVALGVLTLGLAWAQQPQTRRITGTIVNVAGAQLVIRDHSAEELNVTLTGNVVVSGVVRRTLADIKPGLFVGVGALPQADGTQRALRINIFPPGQRPNEGHRPWAGAPQGTMTNAEITSAVADVSGQVLVVKYQGGEQRIIITPETVIIGSLPGERSELKPGAEVLIVQATRKPDGGYEASRINVGRDGVTPM
ncbi:MAG: hypothetical protein IT538_13290 [Variibacter sp.]|nr:hypothetical protein [Variibacter sp.]